MSGQLNVKADTARRVRAAVEELGYRVHGAAASLASGRTRILGVIAISTARYSTSATVVGIETAVAEEGYTVTMASVPDHASSDAFLDAFDRLERQGAEGVILLAPVSFLDSAMGSRTERTPTVLMHSPTDGVGTDMIVDQAEIARLATEHLLELGHKTVWYVSGDDYWVESRVRRQSWEQVLRKHSIDPPPVIPGDWTPESGYRAGRTIAVIPDATAVFVSSDEMAFGVIRALHEAGRQVPDDVSIVSVDDIALAAYAAPALTTVRQPFEAVGRDAAMRLIDVIEKRAKRPIEPVHPELIVRASTAPPRAR